MGTGPTVTDWVIDSDTHVTEPADVWTTRLPAHLAERAPRIVRRDNGVDEWEFGTHSHKAVPVGFTAVAGWPEPFPAAPRNMDEVPEAAHDAKARLAYMDDNGIWAMALYPNVGGFGNEGFLGLGDPELMLACVRAYNDWLIEWCSPDARRFIPIMATPFWDIDETVAEVRRCAELGHKGILFTGEPQRFDMPFLGDHAWDPLWHAAAETGLPVNFHIGSGDMGIEKAVDRMEAHGIAATVASMTVDLFLGNASQVADLLMSGVLPRHPDVHFVSVESGVGWVPFVLEAVDYTLGSSGLGDQRPEFTMRPSDYFRRQVHACAFFEEVAPRELLDLIGHDNVLFETDYPHPVCLFGNVREKIDAAYGALPLSLRRKVLWDNAARLYGVGEPDREWLTPA